MQGRERQGLSGYVFLQVVSERGNLSGNRQGSSSGGWQGDYQFLETPVSWSVGGRKKAYQGVCPRLYKTPRVKLHITRKSNF